MRLTRSRAGAGAGAAMKRPRNKAQGLALVVIHITWDTQQRYHGSPGKGIRSRKVANRNPRSQPSQYKVTDSCRRTRAPVLGLGQPLLPDLWDHRRTRRAVGHFTARGSRADAAPRSHAAPASVHGRFEPGTRLGTRYRFVGRLGRALANITPSSTMSGSAENSLISTSVLFRDSAGSS